MKRRLLTLSFATLLASAVSPAKGESLLAHIIGDFLAHCAYEDMCTVGHAVGIGILVVVTLASVSVLLGSAIGEAAVFLFKGFMTGALVVAILVFALTWSVGDLLFSVFEHPLGFAISSALVGLVPTFHFIAKRGT